MNGVSKLFAGLAIVVAWFVFTAAFMGLPAMLLWNWLMPDIFGLKTITFWQAMGLILLCSTLFRSSVTYKSEK